MTTCEEALKAAANYQRSNKPAQAQKIYQQILKQQPNHPDALLGLAQAAQSVKQCKASKILLDFVLKNHPESTQGWFSLGNIYQSQGQLVDAEAAYRKAIFSQPNSYILYNNLGYILQQQEKWDKAADCYRKALSIEPRFIEAELNLAIIEALQGNLASADREYYAKISNNLGFAKKQAGNLTAAIDYYLQAIKLQPDLVISQYNLGVALQESRKIKEAKSCFEEVLTVTGNSQDTCQSIAAKKLKQLYQGDLNTSKDRKRLAFICQPIVMTPFPPFGKPTDSLGILTHELTRLLAQNFEITIYVPGKIFQEVKHDDITYIYIPTDLDNSLKIAYGKILDNSDDKPLVSSDLYFEGYALMVSQELKKRCCNIVHIWTFSQFIPTIRELNPTAKIILHLGDELLSRLNSKMVEQRLNLVDCIIGCSDYITGIMKERFPEHADLFKTVYNAANIDLFFDGSVPVENLNKSPNMPSKKLLFVGAISPEKGSHILLEAFEKVSEIYPNVELTLAGPIYVIPYEFSISGSNDPKIENLMHFHQGDNWKNYLKKYMSAPSSGIEGSQSSKIHFTGLVPQASLAQYYQQADIFIFPSVWNEPFGMPIVEAMVAGKPVIATQGGAFPEIIDHGKTGLLVERGNSDSLAEAILKLLSDDEFRIRLGNNAYRKAVQYFSFQEMTNSIESVYKSISKDFP